MLRVDREEKRKQDASTGLLKACSGSIVSGLSSSLHHWYQTKSSGTRPIRARVPGVEVERDGSK
jgi:hypothetical protein